MLESSFQVPTYRLYLNISELLNKPFLSIMYIHGSVYVYIAIRVNTLGYIKVFLWQRSFCLHLSLRESDIFFYRWEIIQGFYLGELLRKAKRLKSGRPLAQMVSLSV